MKILATLLAALLLAWTTACSTHREPVFTFEHVPYLDGDPTIFLIAARDYGHIAASLHASGFEVVTQPGTTPYALDVKLGSKRATKKCGTLQNVSYLLTASGTEVLQLKGRGYTGFCDPNILEQMTAQLATRFTELERRRLAPQERN